jgi:hypothetical protein
MTRVDLGLSDIGRISDYLQEGQDIAVLARRRDVQPAWLNRYARENLPDHRDWAWTLQYLMRSAPDWLICEPPPTEDAEQVIARAQLTGSRVLIIDPRS